LFKNYNIYKFIALCYNIIVKYLLIILLSLLTFSRGFAMEENKKAIFAGGCFWGMQKIFDNIKGVVKVTAGYTGGDEINPSYEAVCTKQTGHYEAVEIIFNQNAITYKELLEIFWRNINPMDETGQFVDVGPQYLTAIFYTDELQKRLAEMSKEVLNKSGIFPRKIVTKILSAKKFYPAEEYHQHYYKKEPLKYSYYYSHTGKKEFLMKFWQGKEKFKIFK